MRRWFVCGACRETQTCLCHHPQDENGAQEPLVQHQLTVQGSGWRDDSACMWCSLQSGRQQIPADNWDAPVWDPTRQKAGYGSARTSRRWRGWRPSGGADPEARLGSGGLETDRSLRTGSRGGGGPEPRTLALRPEHPVPEAPCDHDKAEIRTATKQRAARGGCGIVASPPTPGAGARGAAGTVGEAGQTEDACRCRERLCRNWPGLLSGPL